MNKKNHIAITGSSGFIGFHLTKKLLDLDVFLYLITNSPQLIDVKIKNHSNIEIIKGDLSQEAVQYMIINNKIDLIVNLHAQTDLYFAEKNVIQDFNINVLPIVKLFSFLRKEGYKCTFIQIGTVTQCGLTPNTPINETFIDNPATVFDYHKLCAENYIKFNNKNKCINGYCFRLSNVYGGNNILYSTNRGVINKVIKMALDNKTITVYGDGNYLRDYIHINDVVGCIMHSMNVKEKLLGKHIFLCNGKSHTIKEVWTLIAELIEDMYSIKVVVENKKWPDKTLEIEKRNFVADNVLLVDKLGFQPKIHIKDGLMANIKLIHENLIKGI